MAACGHVVRRTRQSWSVPGETGGLGSQSRAQRAENTTHQRRQQARSKRSLIPGPTDLVLFRRRRPKCAGVLSPVCMVDGGRIRSSRADILQRDQQRTDDPAAMHARSRAQNENSSLVVLNSLQYSSLCTQHFGLLAQSCGHVAVPVCRGHPEERHGSPRQR